jgi:hypothetical protein
LIERLEACILLAPIALCPLHVCLCTFIAVYEGILDYHRPAISGCELLGLPAGLPETARIFDMPIGAHSPWNAQHMARKEVFGPAEVNV